MWGPQVPPHMCWGPWGAHLAQRAASRRALEIKRQAYTYLINKNKVRKQIIYTYSHAQVENILTNITMNI